MTCLHPLGPVVSHFLCNPKCDKTSLVQRVSKVQRRLHCPELQLADTADLHSAAVASCGFLIGVPAVAQMSLRTGSYTVRIPDVAPNCY